MAALFTVSDATYGEKNNQWHGVYGKSHITMWLHNNYTMITKHECNFNNYIVITHNYMVIQIITLVLHACNVHAIIFHNLLFYTLITCLLHAYYMHVMLMWLHSNITQSSHYRYMRIAWSITRSLHACNGACNYMTIHDNYMRYYMDITAIKCN